MKLRLKNPVRITAGIVLGAYILLLLAVNMDFVQRRLGRFAGETLQEMTGCRVEVERVSLELFNAVMLENVNVWDRDGRKMLTAPYLNGKIEILPLFHGEVNINSIALLDTEMRLAKDAKGQLNLQPFIDAFSSKDTEKKPLNLSVNSFIMRRGTVDLDSSVIKRNSLKISDIDLNLSLKKLTDDKVNLKLRKLALKLSNGLEIKDLSLKMEATRQHADIKNLRLELPHSVIAQPELKVDYNLKDLAQSLRFKTTLGDCRIGLEDLACVNPALSSRSEQFVVSGGVEYADKFLQFTDLSISERSDADHLSVKSAYASVNLEMSNPRVNVSKLQLQSDMNWVNDMAKTFLNQPLPAQVQLLGRVTANGDLSLCAKPLDIQLTDLHAETALGKVNANGIYHDGLVSGKVQTDGLQLDKLALGIDNLPKFVAGAVEGRYNLSGREGEGKVDLQKLVWRDLTYSDLHLDGLYKNGRVLAHFTSNDEKCRMTADVDMPTDLSQIKVDANVEALNLQPFNNRFKHASGQLSAQVNDIKFSRPSGEVSLTALRLDTLSLERFDVKARPTANGVHLNLESDFANGEFDGPLDLPNLRASAVNIVHRHFPELAPKEYTVTANHKWYVAMNVYDLDLIKKFVKLPLDIDDAVSIQGHLDATSNQASCLVSTPKLTVKNVDLKDVSVNFRSENDELTNLVRVTKPMNGRDMKFEITSRAEAEKLMTDILWGETLQQYRGEMKTQTRFFKQFDGSLGVATRILPANMHIGSTQWTLEPGEIVWKNKNLRINNLSMKNKSGHALRINGVYGEGVSDSLVVDLKNVDVAYIIGFTNFDDVTFDGYATGRGVLKLDPEHPDINLDVRFPQLCLNDAPLGKAHVKGSFEFDDKEIGLYAHLDDEGQGETTVDGFINLSQKRLQLDIDGENTNLAFIQRFVGGIFEDFEGRATGHCRLWGPLKKLDLEGEEVASASFTIPSIGTHYNISHVDVSLTEGQIFFGNALVNDGKKGTGTATGILQHDKLKNLRYGFEIDARNILGYNQPREVGSSLYCTAYGTGHVLLNGYPGRFSADINVKPEKGTTLTYIVDTPETVSNDMRLVKFSSKNQTEVTPEQMAEEEKIEMENSRTDVVVNFTIEATPEAQLRLLMDEKTGDVITLYGDGAIRASWYNKGTFQMWGTYTVDHGDYRMSIQDIIRKNFKFQQGSSMTFTGIPMEGDLDLKAVYTVNSASLADLNAGSISENSVRVNCIMNIGGKAKAPEVTFNLDLPTVNEDEKQMVRRLVATQEDMNMQIIYLLGVGRFYNQDYAATAGENQQAQSATAVNSFISNTLSSQLNEFISSAMQTQNWTVGANLATGTNGWSDMEVEAMLSGRLFNNRLLVNGQFGYRDRPTYSSSQFIGDFDIQYLLTKNGNVTLKAYSETNDRYFTKSSLTTQGIGITLKRNFNTLRELFVPSKILNKIKK